MQDRKLRSYMSTIYRILIPVMPQVALHEKEEHLGATPGTLTLMPRLHIVDQETMLTTNTQM
jgi:hypothetical protein